MLEDREKKASQKENYFKILGEELTDRFAEKMSAVGYTGESQKKHDREDERSMQQKLKEKIAMMPGGPGSIRDRRLGQEKTFRNVQAEVSTTVR